MEGKRGEKFKEKAVPQGGDVNVVVANAYRYGSSSRVKGPMRTAADSCCEEVPGLLKESATEKKGEIDGPLRGRQVKR